MGYLTLTSDNAVKGSQLLFEETVRVRNSLEYLDTTSANALVTDFFLIGHYSCRGMHERAWYHLREATAVIHVVGMDTEEHYLLYGEPEASRRRRLFWLFFLMERAYAIQLCRPLTLQAAIGLPTVECGRADPFVQHVDNYSLLVNLFHPFDNSTTGLWNKTLSHLSHQYMTGLRSQLHELAQSYIYQDTDFNDTQANQQWLRRMIWQFTNGMIMDSSVATIELLTHMASQFPGLADELLCAGLIEVLIKTAYSTTDIFSQPSCRFSGRLQTHLGQIATVLSVCRNGNYSFLPLLLSEVSAVLSQVVSYVTWYGP
ncbi:c6 zinc finger domain containing [Purpureocillium lavendulum]|uniref:C6 zinc finger domain containing n=1 Tax=Purpureocillium lavendulum TaxID=1247861 RepID=A0AB34FE11_9HYPO|nr:c6 zinc finger domain containing [Purpureocillium lavendulum]